MAHELFNLEKWITLFPIETVNPLEWGSIGITSPRDIALLEQVRARTERMLSLGGRILTDVFLFGHGEAPQRDLTKIGGVPYRPANKPWPVSPTGIPYTFLAQFRFSESKDIVGELPGEILLIFIQGRDIGWPDVEQFLLFEWYCLGIEDLVSPQDVPAPAWQFVTCFGVRHRTVDYADDLARRGFYDFVKNHRDKGDAYTDVDALSLCRIYGMKIGGVPTLLPAGLSIEVDVERDLPGRSLGSISSIAPSANFPYPWINHPEPISDVTNPLNMLMFRDGAELNFSLDEEGLVHWTAQFW